MFFGILFFECVVSEFLLSVIVREFFDGVVVVLCRIILLLRCVMV